MNKELKAQILDNFKAKRLQGRSFLSQITISNFGSKMIELEKDHLITTIASRFMIENSSIVKQTPNESKAGKDLELDIVILETEDFMRMAEELNEFRKYHIKDNGRSHCGNGES